MVFSYLRENLNVPLARESFSLETWQNAAGLQESLSRPLGLPGLTFTLQNIKCLLDCSLKMGDDAFSHNEFWFLLPWQYLFWMLPIHSPPVSFQNSDKKQNWSLKHENLLLPCAPSLPVSRGIHSKWRYDGVLAGWIRGTWPSRWLDVLLVAWKKESIRMWNRWFPTVVPKGVNSYIFRCKGALNSCEYTYMCLKRDFGLSFTTKTPTAGVQSNAVWSKSP